MEITIKNLYTGTTFLTNKKIFVSENKIDKIENFQSENYDYEYLAPALIDIHINGGEKYYFTENKTEEALADIEFSAQKNGVGFILPALVTSSPENIFKGIEAVKSYMDKFPDTGILGLHLEGPFISPAKRGAHMAKYVREPDDKLLSEIIEKGKNVVKMITIAPEHFKDHQIKMLLDSGIKVSVGHSNCTFKRATEAFDLGVNLVTHLYNAMSPFNHREPGLIGAALSDDRVFTPIIPDGAHSSFDSVRFAMKNKGNKLFFISDALFQNHKKEIFQWQEFDAKLINGKYINSEGNLAGSDISMAECVKNGINILDLSLQEALEKSSRIPAEVLNLKAGKIEPGFPARFCSFDGGLKEFKFIKVEVGK